MCLDLAAKVRWRKFFDKKNQYVLLQDKLAVKGYAQSRGVKTAKTLFSTQNPSSIPFDDLPNTYFIKANHGWSQNIVCLNSKFYNYGRGIEHYSPDGTERPPSLLSKNEISRQEVIALCETWLNKRHSNHEWAYHQISPQIIIEERLESLDGNELFDYRFYAFEGQVKAINVDSPSFKKAGKNAFFDINWNPFELTSYKEAFPVPPPNKPENLDAMLSAASQLSKDISFVRVDLYNCKSGIILGEMTIYPESGEINSPTSCKKFNKWLGDHWRLNRFQHLVALILNLIYQLKMSRIYKST